MSTLCQDENSSEPKALIRGNTKIGPVLEVTTCFLQGKHGVEIRIESVNKDHSPSWIRISHGLNKLVTNLNNDKQDDNDQETSEMQFEDLTLKSNARAFASRSKAKAKPQRRTSASSSTRTQNLSWKELGPMLYQEIVQSPIMKCQRNWSDEFWRLTDYLRNEFENSRYWSDEKWKSIMARGGGHKKRFQYCTDSPGEIFTSELFKDIQDAILLILHYRTMS